MRGSWRGALGFVLSAGLLYWALHDISFGDVMRELRGSNVLLWAVAITCSQLTFPLRALRWRTILDPVAHRVPFGPLWRAVAIGMMANNVLPLRAGEVARALVLSREEPRVRFTQSMASLVVDRAFDATVILAMLALAMLDPRFSSLTVVGDRTLGAIVIGLALAVLAGISALYAIVFAPQKAESFAAGLTLRIAPRRAESVRYAVHGLHTGLAVLRDRRRFVAVLLWTVAHWLMNAAAIWLSFKALAIDVPISAALLVQGVIAFGVALPSAPGFFGLFEAAGRSALALYAIDAAAATTWALGYHVLSFIPITAIGAWYVGRTGLSFGELRVPSATADQP